ncbi:MAG: hypothetical protein FJY29_02260 [Betaproteobacteria bacterium]|nr:hypothetical protein [Betaproteobacteria bacterium]
MSAALFCGWLPLTLLCVSTVCVTCTSVGKNEQKETLERILKVEEVPKAEPTEAPTPAVTVAAATPTATPTPAPTIDLPGGVRAKPAPNLQQPARMDLPLPRGVVHADLFHFINAHAEVIATYQPLAEEWKLYARMFTPESNISVDEIAALRARVRENLARAHWLFAWGVFQASGQLLTLNQKYTLMVDRQQDFIERMNILVFLMGEMQASGMKTNHRAFLREFYKYVNTKHFKRPMRDRPGKPVGPLNPIQ